MKRSFLIFSALFLAAPLALFPLWRFALKARPQYLSLHTIPYDPIHDLSGTASRPVVWLDGQDWLFQRQGDRVWQPGMTVPACWNLIRGLEDWDGAARYQKRFRLPESFQAPRVRLHFRGVLYRAEVFLNGQPLGHHEGGYTPFSFDVTSALNREGENLIEVVVDNRLSMKTLPGKIKGWRHGGGIYREVYLEGTPEVSIQNLFLQAEPGPKKGRLRAEASLANLSLEPVKTVLTLELLAAEGKLIARAEAPIVLAPGAKEQLQVFSLADLKIRPWSPDHPVLYRARFFLGKGGDEQTVVFGFKRLQTRGRELKLNGEPFKVRGVSRHEDVPRTFRTQTLGALEQDVRMIKALGANAIRLGHYPNHPAMLDLCDREGLLVWEESPTWGDRSPDYGDPEVVALGARQVQEMVQRDRNHVCIGFWGVANEIPSDRPSGVEFVRASVAAGRKLAPGMLFTAASFKGARDRSIGYLDLAAFNTYQGWYYGWPRDFQPDFERLKAAFPDKPILISEYGAGAQAGWHGAYGDIYTEENQARTLEKRFRLIEDDPECAGGLIWLFADFQDDMRLLNPRPYFNQKGLVDYDRQEKLAYSVVKELFHSPAREVPVPGQSRILPRVVAAGLAALTLVMLLGSLSSGIPRTWRLLFPESPSYRKLVRRAFWMSATAGLYLFLVSRIGLLSQPLALPGPDLTTLRILHAILNSALSPAFAFYGCLWLWLAFSLLADRIGRALGAKPQRSALEITLGVGDPLAWILPYALVLPAPVLFLAASGLGIFLMTGAWRGAFSTIPSLALAVAFSLALLVLTLKAVLVFRAGFQIGFIRSCILILLCQALLAVAVPGILFLI